MSALTSHVVNSGLPVHSGKFRCSGLETEGLSVRGFSFHLQLFRSFNTHLYQTQYSSHILIISFDVPSSSAVIRPVIHTYGVRIVIRYDALESHSYLVILCTVEPKARQRCVAVCDRTQKSPAACCFCHS